MPGSERPEEREATRSVTGRLGRALGLVLCVAGVLKAIGTPASPRGGLGLVLSLAGTGVELLVGMALVVGLRPSLSIPAAGVLFMILAGVSAIGTSRGATSCGCFGRWDVPPAAFLVFDLAAALALLLKGHTNVSGKGRRPVWIAAAALAGFYVGLVTGSLLDMRPGGETSEISRASLATARTVRVDPARLRGDAAPLLEYVRIDADLSSGDWTIILARPGCSHCERGLRGGACRPRDGGRVAVVVARDDATTWNLPAECRAVLGRLSPRKNWAFTAPLILHVVDGRFAPD